MLRIPVRSLKAATFSVVLALSAFSQDVINSLPIRTFGSTSVTPIVNVNPNLVEGREFFQPMGIAVDAASGAVYVADTRNHRVLGFANYLAFQNGAAASLVIGQSDFVSAFPGGPASGRPDTLNSPTGLAVDAAGNLYVVDTANQRILRFPKPTENWPGEGSRLQPDLVIGQSDLNSVSVNQGGAASATSLSFPGAGTVASLSAPARVGIAFDSSGNLWVADWGNHRALRFPAASLGQNASNAPAADLVLGQPDFTTTTLPASGTLAARSNKATVRFPSGVAYIPTGNLICVVDSIGRVLVYENPSANAQAAARILGVPTQAQLSANVTVAANVLAASYAVFAVNNETIGVADTFNNRILVYPPYASWPGEVPQLSPNASLVIGQADLSAPNDKANRGTGVPGDDRLNRPFDAVAAGGKLLVVDTLNHRVLRHTVNSGPTVTNAEAVLGQTAMSGGAPNLVEGRELNYPGAIAFDYSSDPPRVYVADTGNNRVLGFRDVGRLRDNMKADVVFGQPDLISTIANYPGGQAETPTQKGLVNPLGLAVDAQGNVYVADAGNGRVVRYAKPDFDNPVNGPDANLVLGQANFTSKNVSATQATLNSPQGLALTANGSLAVADRVHHRVLYYPAPFSNGMAATKVLGQGSFVGSDAGDAGNRLNSPRGLIVDAGNRLYVADYNNRRVQIFDNVDGLPALDVTAGTSLTRALGATETLTRPEGLAYDRETGEFWVTEFDRRRVLVYPDFLNLVLNNLPARTSITTVAASGNGAISIALDALGRPVVGEALHRVALYFARVATTNGATFFIGQPTTTGVGHLAPNTIASAFSFSGNFDRTRDIPTTNAQSLPLPLELEDLELTLDGRPLPLFFVSKSQINFFLPNNVPQTGVVLIEIRRKSTGDILAGDFFGMAVAAPGLFTTNAQGNGQVAAINYNGSTPAGNNSASNRVARGQVIAVFGTGMGFVPGAPDDGSAVSGALNTPEKPNVAVGAAFVLPDNVEYSGFAPGFVGLWQINIKIPDNTGVGDLVPCAFIYKTIFSTRGVLGNQVVTIPTTIAVRQP